MNTTLPFARVLPPLASQRTSSFVTPQTMRWALRQSAAMIRIASRLRVAALSQPFPNVGASKAVRLNWSDEPDRVANFMPVKSEQCKRNVTSVFEVFEGDLKVGISVALTSTEALENAKRATTRMTASKLDSDSGDYDNLSVKPL